MSDTDTQTDLEREKLEAWRLHCLLRAGWETHRAELLAGRFDIDLHQAIQIVERGCDQRLALTILL